MPDLSKTKLPTSLLVLLSIVFSLLSEQSLAAYCNASGSNLYHYIKGVQVGSINNIPTGNSIYADYTSLSTTMRTEVGYPITVTRGKPWSDEYDKCGLWVDWNRDEDFYDFGEEIVMSLGVDPCTFTGTITPPAGAVLGDTRMRIRIVWNEIPQPCGGSTYGEVEDYTIEVFEDNTGRISGVKFNDLNGNGIQETGELGLAGWEIYLDLNDNGQWDAGEPKDVTDSSGFYEFSNLDPCDYTVAEIPKAGWEQTLPGWTGSRLFAVEENTPRYFIHELDPCDGAVINTFPVPEEITGLGLQGLAVGPASLFFAGIIIRDEQPISVIWELDVETGTVIDTDAVELGAGFYPMSLAYLDDRVYIGKFTTGGPPNETEIAVFDPVQDTIVNTIIVHGTLGDGITGAADRGVLYATWSYDKIAEIEPATGSILRTINHTAGFKQGMAYLDGVIMMSSWARDLVHLIDPDTGQTLGSFILPENSYSSALGGDGIPATAYRAEIISGETFNLDFGNIETNSCGIKGTKWNDLDCDGIRDQDEPALEGWKIYIDTNKNGKWDDGEPYDLTNSNGNYELGGLMPDTYVIAEVPQICWEQNFPGGDKPHTLTVSHVRTYEGYDFGNALADWIRGSKFLDLNGNGTRDSGDPGLEGWEIYIDANDNGQYDIGETRTITDSNGDYKLVTWSPGTYIIAEVIQDHWGQTFPGGNETHSVIVGIGELVENVHFGNLYVGGYAGGSGTPTDPYLISTPGQMNYIGADSNDWDKHFKLIADVNLAAYTGTEFNVIGERHYDLGWVENPFTGVFDGNGHTISNFTYTCTGADYIGIFGYVAGGDAEIKNLGLIDPNIDAGTGGNVGALVGMLVGGSVSGCYVQGASIYGTFRVGGLAGQNAAGILTNCYADSNVSAAGPVGGLVGTCNEYAVVTNCYANSSVLGDHTVGGLVGFCAPNAMVTNSYAKGIVSANTLVGGLVGVPNVTQISDCYATASVSGNEQVGGLVGRNYLATVSNCYSVGKVSGSGTYVGGLVGENWSGGAKNCVWDVNTSGTDYSEGGTGKTTAEMQDPNTFTSMGWDFVGEIVNGPEDIWTIHEGQDYPKLVWKLVNFTGWYEVDYADFAFFAGRWRQINCGDSNDCDGADLDFSDAVDGEDLKIFCDYWLAGL